MSSVLENLGLLPTTEKSKSAILIKTKVTRTLLLFLQIGHRQSQ